ncbi:hypothetical protein [Acidisphaera sp. S103]|uniref:hypothetical protein n=1 Tax=Acidisphaera sp. S103 TaxID=1747223 RepID=UPI00131D78CF|nr:hypothetical protein [Acidisphaera sp. S103]
MAKAHDPGEILLFAYPACLAWPREASAENPMRPEGEIVPMAPGVFVGYIDFSGRKLGIVVVRPVRVIEGCEINPHHRTRDPS